jgi:hypothetical protein
VSTDSANLAQLLIFSVLWKKEHNVKSLSPSSLLQRLVSVIESTDNCNFVDTYSENILKLMGSCAPPPGSLYAPGEGDGMHHQWNHKI